MRAFHPSLRTAALVARDLRRIAGRPAEVRDCVRLLARKGRGVALGLYYLVKKDRQETLSIGSLVARNAERDPNGTAILFEDARYTHRDLHEISNRWASVLAARGVGHGDSVAVLIDNRPEILFVIAGIVKLGAIAAVLNTKQRRNVLEHSIRAGRASTFVIGEELWDAFAEVRGGLGGVPAERVLWLRDQGSGGAPAGATDASPALAAASISTPAATAKVKAGDACFYVYTSGTTGLPKASIMTHFRWVKGGGGAGNSLLALKPADILYVALPFYHNNALTIGWGSAVLTGAALAIRRKFSVTHFWDDVRRHRATAFVYIGELCRYLLNQPPSRGDLGHGVRCVIGNGLRPDIWRAFKERFGIREVYEFYAASEAPIAFVNLFNLDCTVGFCAVPYEVVLYDVDRDEPVRDEAGHLVRAPRGGVGLLIAEIREDDVFEGYADTSANEKKLLRNVFKRGDLWFNSGDLIRDLGFGHAQFVDRLGDTFRWKGENVSTNEVAEALNLWPDVAESTVYGVEVPGAEGRCGMASLVARVPIADFDFEGFSAHVRAQLPSYARPVFLRMQEAIEATGTFKQMKGELRSQGYDPALVSDPLYVWRSDRDGYSRLDPALHASIQRGGL